MPVGETPEITASLRAWNDDDPEVESALFEAVNTQLQRLARNYLSKERCDHTLEPGALVNETYLRLRRQRHVAWRNRNQFFAIAATTMKRVLRDHARAKDAKRRNSCAAGPQEPRKPTERGVSHTDVMRLNLALEKLARKDLRLVRTVCLHVCEGLTLYETAQRTGRSRRTIARDWALAKAWLARELGA